MEAQEPESTGAKKRNLIVGVVAALTVLAIVYVANREATSSAGFENIQLTPVADQDAVNRRPVIGGTAPDFELPSLDGQRVRLSQFRGRPVWINFWTTWCPPCRAEAPDMEAVYKEKGGGERFVLLAVDIGESPTTVRDYVAKAGLSYTIVLDLTTAVASRYGVVGIPTHFFIDKDGIIRDMQIGAMSRSLMERKLAKVLGD